MATKARVTNTANATLARTIMNIFTMTGAPLVFGFGRWAAAVSGIVGAGAASAAPAGFLPLEFFFCRPCQRPPRLAAMIRPSVGLPR